MNAVCRHLSMNHAAVQRQMNSGKDASATPNRTKAVRATACRRMNGAPCANRSTGPAAIFIRSGVDLDKMYMRCLRDKKPVLKVAGFFIGGRFVHGPIEGWYEVVLGASSQAICSHAETIYASSSRG